MDRRETEGGDPTQVGRYTILERLGAGGMGVVYRAHDPELDRVVAVKVLRPGHAQDEGEDQARRRLVREARALARLAHPHVIHVYDVGTLDADQVFVTMEHVEGSTLGAWLTAAPRAPEEIVRVFLQAGEGLVAAHEAGLVHRDFKPDNVMVGRDGRVRVLDFGLARGGEGLARPVAETWSLRSEASSEEEEAPVDGVGRVTRTGAIVGTPLYMAPEQVCGEPATPLSDQYSFFVSLYEALYRRAPYDGDTTQSYLSRVLRGELRPPPSDHPARRFWPVLETGLAAEPAVRHASLEEGLALLQLELDDSLAFLREPGSTLEAAPASAMASGSARPWVGVAVVLAAVVVAVLLAWRADDGPAPALDDAGPSADLPVRAARQGSASVAASPPAPAPAASADAPAPVEEVAVAAPSAEVAAAASQPAAAAARTQDACYFHEDHYTLLRRARGLGDHVRADDGRCYACRRETRASRIARLRPDDCGRYYLCGPDPGGGCG